MAKKNPKKMTPMQKSLKSVVAPKSSKAPATNKAKAQPKKAVPTKPVPAKKPDAKKAAPAATQKKAAATAKAKAPAVAPKKTAAAAPAPVRAPSRRIRFNKTDLKQFQIELIAMRDRITNQSGSMRSAALQRTDEVNTEEDGTDAFMRLQTLEQVGTQQGIITKIDEALHAIGKGTYGTCDVCGALISKERLSVLPFARNCIQCQSEMERTNRYGRHR